VIAIGVRPESRTDQPRPEKSASPG
jgi:hypothetical protein